MTVYESALSDLAARLSDGDHTLTSALRDILAAALQDLIEAELTAKIGAAPGERTPSGWRNATGTAPSSSPLPPAISRSASRSSDRDRSSPSSSNPAAASTRPCGQ